MSALGTRTETDEHAFRQAVTDLAVTALGGVEGLDRASCSANITFLAEVGIGAAARGCSSQGWRAEASKARGPDAGAELDAAEECMRRSGLWPWA